MRITELSAAPFHALGYVRAAPGGSREWATLPFLTARANASVKDVDAIVCTSDLQGRDGPDGRLLGEAVADELAALCSTGDLPPRDRTGIVLAGDLFARPGLDRRGGLGDVDAVWEAFGKHFGWVVGVAGNHDSFRGRGGGSETLELLDATRIHRDGLQIAGLSGIVGPDRKPWRREESDYLEALRSVADPAPDLLVLHDGPRGDAPGQRGSDAIREVLEACPRTCVVRGHVNWPDPLAELANGTQVLNVDGRVVVISFDH